MKHGLLPIGAAAVLLLAGCTSPDGSAGGSTSGATASASAVTAAAASPSASSTPSAPKPSSTTASPTNATTAAASPSAQPSSPGDASTTTAPLTLYYVAQGDDGVSGAAIGCGDSLVATYTEPVAFTDQLRASMQRIVSDDSQFLGQSGLYNALYMSDLVYESGSVEGDTVTVNLSGKVVLGGVCDGPRLAEQLAQTAETAVGVGSSVLLVNGVPLSELLGQK